MCELYYGVPWPEHLWNETKGTGCKHPAVPIMAWLGLIRHQCEGILEIQAEVALMRYAQLPNIKQFLKDVDREALPLRHFAGHCRRHPGRDHRLLLAYQLVRKQNKLMEGMIM